MGSRSRANVPDPAVKYSRRMIAVKHPWRKILFILRRNIRRLIGRGGEMSQTDDPNRHIAVNDRKLSTFFHSMFSISSILYNRSLAWESTGNTIGILFQDAAVMGIRWISHDGIYFVFFSTFWEFFFLGINFPTPFKIYGTMWKLMKCFIRMKLYFALINYVCIIVLYKNPRKQILMTYFINVF